MGPQTGPVLEKCWETDLSFIYICMLRSYGVATEPTHEAMAATEVPHEDHKSLDWWVEILKTRKK